MGTLRLCRSKEIRLLRSPFLFSSGGEASSTTGTGSLESCWCFSWWISGRFLVLRLCPGDFFPLPPIRIFLLPICFSRDGFSLFSASSYGSPAPYKPIEKQTKGAKPLLRALRNGCSRLSVLCLFPAGDSSSTANSEKGHYSYSLPFYRFPQFLQSLFYSSSGPRLTSLRSRQFSNGILRSLS